MQAGGKVYVHCWAGVSRSPTLCIAYLMKHRGLSMDDARDYVRKVRPHIRPNWGFEEMLKQFEKTLKQERRVPEETGTGGC